ncbi:MAG: hypothetical protein J4F36_00945 [Nitrosopumilaceae archaeon]|nr:hypothetical protein [Nitrosopumilaceae archaeon]
MVNTGNRGFDPDELILTKFEILEFCDRVIKKWNKHPSKNAKNILAMNAVKTSVLWTDEDSLKSIWGEIIAWTFELLYENAMAQDKEWANMLKKLKNKK